MIFPVIPDSSEAQIVEQALVPIPEHFRRQVFYHILFFWTCVSQLRGTQDDDLAPCPRIILDGHVQQGQGKGQQYYEHSR